MKNGTNDFHGLELMYQSSDDEDADLLPLLTEDYHDTVRFIFVSVVEMREEFFSLIWITTPGFGHSCIHRLIYSRYRCICLLPHMQRVCGRLYFQYDSLYSSDPY